MPLPQLRHILWREGFFFSKICGHSPKMKEFFKNSSWGYKMAYSRGAIYPVCLATFFFKVSNLWDLTANHNEGKKITLISSLKKWCPNWVRGIDAEESLYTLFFFYISLVPVCWPLSERGHWALHSNSVKLLLCFVLSFNQTFKFILTCCVLLLQNLANNHFQHTLTLYLTPLHLKWDKSEDMHPVHRSRHQKRSGFCQCLWSNYDLTFWRNLISL